MKNFLRLLSIILIFLSGTSPRAQINLNWASSFSPVWGNGNTSGSANNIGGYSINATATVTMNGPGSFTQALGSSGANTPTVSGATFTVPGTSERLQVTTNYNQNTTYTDIVLTLTMAATNVTFKIVDIDKNTSTSTTYFDQVIVTGANGATNYTPTLTRYDAVTDPNFLVISGNVASVNTTSGQAGNTASDATDQRGTVVVDFGTNSVKTITIRYNNAAGADNNPAAQSIAVGSVSFSQSTLPVSLLGFSGYMQSKDVVLNWSTAQELNADHFDIERSTDNTGWEKIGTVSAAGTSNSLTNYTYRDINPQGNILLYRLKQADINGFSKYSQVVHIVPNTGQADIKVYPNPFVSEANIILHSPSDQLITISLINAARELIRTETRQVYKGVNNISIQNLGTLSTGVYFIDLKNTDGKGLGQTQLLKY